MQRAQADTRKPTRRRTRSKRFSHRPGAAHFCGRRAPGGAVTDLLPFAAAAAHHSPAVLFLVLLLAAGAGAKLPPGVLVREKPLAWYYLHIPKAAGSSFALTLQHLSNLTGIDTSKRVRQNEGCASYALSGERRSVFLRKPSQHVMSQYVHCMTAQVMIQHDHSPRTMPETFDTWLEGWHRTLAKPDARNGTRWPRHKCYNPINLQCTRLTCQTPCNWHFLPYGCEGCAYRSRPSLEAWQGCNFSSELDCNERSAHDALLAMDFVGIVEHFRESVCLFFSMVTGVLPPGCRCEEQEGQSGAFAHAYDSSKGKAAITQRVANKDPATRQALLTSLTAKDDALYEVGVKRFWKLLRREEARQNASISCDAPPRPRGVRAPRPEPMERLV